MSEVHFHTYVAYATCALQVVATVFGSIAGRQAIKSRLALERAREETARAREHLIEKTAELENQLVEARLATRRSSQLERRLRAVAGEAGLELGPLQ